MCRTGDYVLKSCCPVDITDEFNYVSYKYKDSFCDPYDLIDYQFYADFVHYFAFLIDVLDVE